MIRTIAQKEVISALRDRRFILASLLVFLLLLGATLVGRHHHGVLQHEREMAQHTVNEQWAQQPDRHPHRMAHYGSFAFRPKSPLSLLDFGTDSFTGASVFLEAHKQNSVNFSQAQQSGSLIRFGELTVAFVLQMLFPLLIIFLCFAAFTHEKENSTLTLLLSQGITLRQVAWSKIIGYSQLLTIIILPGLVLAGFLLLNKGEIILEADLLYRLLLFTGFYLLYFFIWVVGSVVVSACYSYSRNALVTLLGIWIFSCILLPKAAANIGAGLFPGVTKAQMDAAVHEETLKGIDGHDPQNQRTEELKLVLLKKYGVDSVSQLPVNVDGLIMAAGEEYSSQVYQKHFAQLVNTYHKQNQVSVWAGYLNPYLAIRTISMGLAASDFNHFVHFQQAAENYRYQLVQRLNYLQTNKLRPGDKTFRLSRETWREFAPFHYQAPPVSWSLTSQIWSLVALLTWVVALTWWGLNKINSINILT